MPPMNLPGIVRIVVKAKAEAKAESSGSLTLEPRPLAGPVIVAPADSAEGTGHSHSSGESPELLFESGSDHSDVGGPMRQEHHWDRVKRNNEQKAQQQRRHRNRQQSDQR